MDQQEISKIIAKELKIPYKSVSKILTCYSKTTRDLVYKGHSVNFKGLATFKMEVTEETKRYSFLKKEIVTTPKRFRFKIVPSAAFSKKINNKPIGF